MENDYVTTPFGRRGMSLGMLVNQQIAETIEPGTRRNKWKLFRAICEARLTLGVTERALTVLDALLTFYPGDELAEGQGLVVFPSNAQLTLRARGMAQATLRRHLAVLVEAGLVVRKDSPNGKRYVRRDNAGDIDEAYGFSLAPLLARAREIETSAAHATADRELLRVVRERLTICRRDIAKLIASATEEAVPGDWERIFLVYRALVTRMPRVATIGSLAPILDELAMLRSEIVNILETHVVSEELGGRESRSERHIQNSKPEFTSELEPSFETKQGAKFVIHQDPTIEPKALLRQEAKPPSNRRGEAGGDVLKSFPLGMVMQACPQMVDYGPGGGIANWRDLMSAAIVVRSMLGVSPSAYQEACAVMGPENAATVMACILERGGQINSAGGYLRDLTRRADHGEFGLGPMLMALLRTNGPNIKLVS